MTGKSYGPTEMIISGASPGDLPGLPAGEATPSRQANRPTGGRHPQRSMYGRPIDLTMI